MLTVVHRALRHVPAAPTPEEALPLLPRVEETEGNARAALLKRHKRAAFRLGAMVSGPVSALAALAPASSYICAKNKIDSIGPDALCRLVPPGLSYFTRTLPNRFASQLGEMLPASLYVTWGTQKIADAIAVAYFMAVYDLPWESETALLRRRPGQPWPSGCTRPDLPNCPDILSWKSADEWVGGVNAVVCLTTAATLGALLGGFMWRDGVSLIAKIPVERLPNNPWTIKDLILLDRRSWWSFTTEAGRFVVKKAKSEVEQRRLLTGADGV